MPQKIICVVCPMGCEMTVAEQPGGGIAVTGNTCNRGEAYGIEEYLHPSRLLTSSVKIGGSMRKMLPVRSTGHIPKELLLDCMEVIHGVIVSAPVEYHQIIIKNILGTGIDIEASMPAAEEIMTKEGRE